MILAFDTTCKALSVALIRDGKVIAEHFESRERGHAAHLLPSIISLLEQENLYFKDLKKIVTTVGPGSFTGIRIGISTGRALALAGNIPLVGVTTFRTLATALNHQQAERKHTLVVIDTKRNEVYTQLLSPSLEEVGEAVCLYPEEIPSFLPEVPLRIIGDGQNLIKGEVCHIPNIEFDPSKSIPHAKYAGLSAINIETADSISPFYLKPAYVRSPKQI
ncbi:MAG: tRNA (adenosine(37)-N6)-threonylcarbamoyltransferase complex dimerization subunit type 1 TsaB [Alphaproteobacteria bacterium]|jgi:tRNA threonylcarbamoyladenosine biosynthesis protein TsaB|nr:tRNA (adenosine(37)-N6)-threonylcarbamoyltransferase complex dimerization subunit type 1 TsaB [Alphaproteobacteria bacterium]MBT5389532.1 tRNA (adenosine(37)-N6)-threonylcarbamoyltransferase complex dimerization subunit type 1 TsaB [Alphaproteobacteria bacterium]MBT5540830.1 tRNA (adenosine(37)-N6)-threonylcarbamoyltransferase complex dimerization subunit type 1 TsaB [Alphaproteobacteria bacterium]MBT5653887.1 tRNA (adenosine(37)-N6)-threonylcarbamoyltransferase complex dimerization subunit t